MVQGGWFGEVKASKPARRLAKMLPAIKMKDKKRNLLRKEWPFLRADIERVRKELNVNDNEFRELNIKEWNTIKTKIEKHFLYERPSNVKRSWLWNDLKTDTFGIACEYDPYEKLEFLIDKNEIVYFMVNETVNESTKYWYYEGNIESIISVIGESLGIDEYYIISKKYDWFLCTNHHNVLIGTGPMISRMKENEDKIKKVDNTVIYKHRQIVDLAFKNE